MEPRGFTFSRIALVTNWPVCNPDSGGSRVRGRNQCPSQILVYAIVAEL